MKSKFVAVVLLLLVLSSCGQNNKANIMSRLIGMKTYEAEAQIYVYGDGTETRYAAKQYYKYPDKLRMEIKEPSFLSGQVIVYNSGKCTIFNPSINMELSYDKLKEEEDYVSAGFLLRTIAELKDIRCVRDSIDGIEYTVFSGSIPNGNEYRSKVAVYFENLGETPAYMDIMDSHGRVRVKVKYTKFKYNAEIKEEMFTNVKPTGK